MCLQILWGLPSAEGIAGKSSPSAYSALEWEVRDDFDNP